MGESTGWEPLPALTLRAQGSAPCQPFFFLLFLLIQDGKDNPNLPAAYTVPGASPAVTARSHSEQRLVADIQL